MTTTGARLSLTKHHGLGNDFLVLLDETGRWSTSPQLAELAVRLCHRRTGVGADGLIVASPAAAEAIDAVMHLRNADGTRAELSGNGIRCLAQALVDGGWASTPAVTVVTDAGRRVLDVSEEDAPGRRTVRVDMGKAVFEADGGAMHVDMGNPHLVVRVDDPAKPGLVQRFGRKYPDRNVELVRLAPGEPGVLEMRVHERGVGETLACGTGACATAVAGRAWGLAGDRVVVRQPGGEAVVDLGDTITLTGPTQLIASIEVSA